MSEMNRRDREAKQKEYLEALEEISIKAKTVYEENKDKPLHQAGLEALQNLKIYQGLYFEAKLYGYRALFLADHSRW